VRYVALLRGINVGAHRRISMADLRSLFDELGCAEARTYLQSGNVVFESNRSASRLAPALERAIADRLAPDVSVLLRAKSELTKVTDANPFAAHEQSKLHVTFLAKRPTRGRAAALDPTAGAPDEFRLLGRELYLYYPGGYGRSKLSNAYFEKALGVAATTRNWKTVTALAELLRG